MFCGYIIKNDLSFRDYDIKLKMKFKIFLSKSFLVVKGLGDLINVRKNMYKI